MRVVVVGGSIAGLAAGLVLTRSGHEVTILERDGQPTPPTPELAASEWRRGGVPQTRHPHGFICRVRAELLAAAPDLWRDLLEAGAVELDLFASRPVAMRHAVAEPGDADLVFLLCRRSTFEWVLRRAVDRECDLRLGVRVDELVIDERHGVQRVVGVRSPTGTLDADLVVDASGRSGGLTRRLKAAGIALPPTEDEPCGIEYTSRIYRLRSGATRGPLNRMWAAGGVFAGYSCVLFPHDAGTLTVTFGRLPNDAALVGVHKVDGFERAVAAVPFVQDWLDPARVEPLGPPFPMAGIHNMLAPRPTITGLVGIGDAVCTTDPSFGRGAAIALASGFALAAAVDEADPDVDAAADRFARWFNVNVLPWHRDSVAQDRGRTAVWRAATADEPPAMPPPAGSPAMLVAAAIAGVDPSLWRGFVRYAGLLDPPSALQSTDAADRVSAVLATGWLPTAVQGPSHREMADLVSPRP